MVTKWLQDDKISVLEWPSQRAGLSPVGRAEVETRSGTSVTTVAVLKQRTQLFDGKQQSDTDRFISYFNSGYLLWKRGHVPHMFFLGTFNFRAVLLHVYSFCYKNLQQLF